MPVTDCSEIMLFFSTAGAFSHQFELIFGLSNNMIFVNANYSGSMTGKNFFFCVRRAYSLKLMLIYFKCEKRTFSLKYKNKKASFTYVEPNV